MEGLCYIDKEKLEIKTFPLPKITSPNEVIIEIKYASLCTSDIHIIKDKVPRAKKGIILGHEGVGIIKEIGSDIKKFKIGDKVSINCISFCGECYFCKNNYINNCNKGGWELGCRINGTLSKYVLVPFAETSLNLIPENFDLKKFLFVGDALSSGFFGVEMGNLKDNNIACVLGCGPVGLCTLICCKMKGIKTVAFDINEQCLEFAKKNNLSNFYINPEKLKQSENNFLYEQIIDYIKNNNDNSNNNEEINNFCEKLNEQKGFDCCIEVAGTEKSFEMAWKLTRPNGIVSIVAMYEKNLEFKLPLMYGKNLIFKTGGVDAVYCDSLIKWICENKINTDLLITHEFNFEDVIKAFDLFRNKNEFCCKIAIKI